MVAMMSMIGSVQFGIFTLLSIAAFVFELCAFVDSLRYSNEVYNAAGKQTRIFWVAILGVATLLSFIALPPMFIRVPFVTLLGVVAAGVYFADVRKALRAVDPRFRGR